MKITFFFRVSNFRAFLVGVTVTKYFGSYFILIFVSFYL
jgi:hypothetical protein